MPQGLSLEDALFALRRIRDARDHRADSPGYRPDGMGEDQCFDDWAADIADAVLQRAAK